MKALLPLVLFSTLANAQAPVAGRAIDSITFSGHVTRSDNGKPIEGATVILTPCVVCQGGLLPKLPAHDPVTTTAADGSYRFTNFPRSLVGFIQAARTGFVPGLAGCNVCAGQAISVDIKLEPAAVPTQMDDGAVKAAYGDKRLYVDFDNTTFTHDGNVLQFVTEDVDDRGPKMGWQYDLRTLTLEPGPLPIFGDRGGMTWSYDPSNSPIGQDPDRVGDYEIEEERECRGCGDSIFLSNVKTGIRFKIADEVTGGLAGSSDGKVIFWFNANKMAVFNLNTRRTVHVTLPYAPTYGLWGLTARPEGDGYLLVYDAMGACNTDGAALTRQVESDQAREVLDKDQNERAPKPQNVCFLHVRLPTR